MSKIAYPCETAVIYEDTIYPITLNSKHDIELQLRLAVGWFRRWFTVSEEVIREKLLVSFWGLYLTNEQAMECAA